MARAARRPLFSGSARGGAAGTSAPVWPRAAVQAGASVSSASAAGVREARAPDKPRAQRCMSRGSAGLASCCWFCSPGDWAGSSAAPRPRLQAVMSGAAMCKTHHSAWTSSSWSCSGQVAPHLLLRVPGVMWTRPGSSGPSPELLSHQRRPLCPAPGTSDGPAMDHPLSIEPCLHLNRNRDICWPPALQATQDTPRHAARKDTFS